MLALTKTFVKRVEKILSPCYGICMDVYTVAAAARELGITEQALRHRIRRGEVRAQRIGARLWVIEKEEVERWRNQGRLKPGRKRQGSSDA